MNKLHICYVCGNDIGLFAGSRVTHEGLCNKIYKYAVRSYWNEKQTSKKEMAQK